MTGAKSVSASFSPIPTPSPVVTLYTKPEPEGNDTSVVLSSGEDITLIWSSTNATSCTFIPQEAEKDGNWSGHAGPVGTSGSITAPVIGDTTFTFTCTGGGGTTSQTIKAVIGESAMNSSSSQLANVIGSVTKNVSITENVISPGKFYFTKWLEEGSSGNEVMELQKFLNNVGYDSGTVDGKFGSRTEEALIRLQIANGLKSDGIVGYEVRSFLNK
ncbi:hypothetical protein A3A03_02175 [Candidatus Nomurabacteria bacterium RIFCSPLOWO2_01_FULL_40_18]|uniref:Peptidoglycan binding-like domain-containing protein n=1 Tax=Candidatus Nomurabacteria bacterium RIFCSPLOWO2_01_FULL_40_18 TaxID=1801773 RepID=A0A1F6XLS4_9BACT|nr:MAG: hypothetical protein A3A03_02175 [Candidatus Nomurabacteria bacterium RIFCSPLOWO2_01_FULL_40_18]